MNIKDAILIVGGYGVVGGQVTRLIRQRHPDIPLLIAGRNVAKAETLANELNTAHAVFIDTEQPAPLNGLLPRAIVAVTNDPHDYLFQEALKAGIAYLDITRWTERLRSTVDTAEAIHAPVLLSSAWMAGIPALISAAIAQHLTRVDSIDISVLYRLKDKSGPNSIEYMDRLVTPFTIMLEGELKQVYPLTDPRNVTFPSGYKSNVYRFDTPEQFTLPTTTGARTVSVRIAFDDMLSTRALVFLTRTGIWKLISGKAFKSLRQKILYNPGSGANHEIVIEVLGTEGDAQQKSIRATVSDPKGQAHLTAVGALIQLERLLGLDGEPPPLPAIVYPDTAPCINFALQFLVEHGVSIDVSGINFKDKSR